MRVFPWRSSLVFATIERNVFAHRFPIAYPTCKYYSGRSVIQYRYFPARGEKNVKNRGHWKHVFFILRKRCNLPYFSLLPNNRPVGKGWWSWKKITWHFYIDTIDINITRNKWSSVNTIFSFFAQRSLYLNTWKKCLSQIRSTLTRE